MIYRLDGDLNGTDSIQPLIDAGLVDNRLCYSFPDFQREIAWVVEHAKPAEDLVVIDSASTIVSSTRVDLKFGSSDAQLWEQRDKFFGDKQALNVYQAATSLFMRYFRNLRSRKIRMVLVCHEEIDDVEDPMTGVKSRELGPALNPELRESIIRASSDVFRLYALKEDKIVNGEIVFKKDLRVLQLRDDGTFRTKFQVARHLSESVPRVMQDPTLPKLWQTLGKRSAVLLLYGPAGAGKTTASCSEAEEELAAATPTKRSK